MSETVLIPYGDDASKTAQRLLAAAEALDYDLVVVRHQPDDGGFRVTEDVAAEGGFGEPDEPEAEAGDTAEEKKAPAKKTTAKKTAAKKTPAKG